MDERKFSRDELNRAKETLKQIPPEELEARGIVTKCKHGYICPNPNCRNGSGRDGTGSQFKLGDNGWELLCGKCTDGYDIIDILGFFFNLKTDTDFPEIVKKGCELFGITFNGDYIQSDIPVRKATEKKPVVPDQFKGIIEQAHGRIGELLQKHGGQWRGLNRITLDYFYIGYLPQWFARKDAPTSPRVIIPTSFNHYLARLDADIKNFNVPDGVVFNEKEHRGCKEIFNFKNALLESTDDICFMVEGEIDAMSIAQSQMRRDPEKGYVPAVNVVAISGSKLSADNQRQLKSLPPKKFIVMLDNDETGKKSAPLVVSTLQALGHQAVARFLPDNFNDANDFLRADPEYLAYFIETTFEEAKKFFKAAQVPAVPAVPAVPKLGEEKISADTDDNLPQDNDGELWTQELIKSCPVNLKLPQGYTMSTKHIWKILPPKKKQSQPQYVSISRTPIVLTGIYTDEKDYCTEYEVAMLVGHQWRRTIVPGETLLDARGVGCLKSKGALFFKGGDIAEFLSNFIADNWDSIPKIKVYKQTGWTDDECEKFGYPTSNGDAVVRRAGYDYEKIFKPKGDRDEWKKKFSEVTNLGGPVARTIIGSACAAPLVKMLEDVPNLQVHLFGKKSIGKTPMLKFAVSIFGDTKVGALTHTFAATPKSRLETACAFSDLPLICEELESIGSKDVEKLSQDIYNYYLGISGQALKKDGTLRDPKLFSGARLTSGEHSLVQHNGNGGELKRVLGIRASELLPEDFASNLYSFCNRNHGLFGELWIRYISANRDIISQEYHQCLKNVIAFLNDNHQERDLTQLRTLILSGIAYQHFKSCIGLQESGNDKEVLDDIDAIIRTLPFANEIDDTTRAIKDLSSFVASHEKSFIHVEENKDTGKPNETSAWGIVCHGKIFDTGEVAFFPTELKKILEDELGFTSAKKLIDEWKDKGNVLITDKGRTTHKIRLGNKTARVIHFAANIISTDTDAAELDYYEKQGVL